MALCTPSAIQACRQAIEDDDWSNDKLDYEAAGATRVKRLRDALGNQLVSELLVKTIARRGYMLAVGKDTIRMI